MVGQPYRAFVQHEVVAAAVAREGDALLQQSGGQGFVFGEVAAHPFCVLYHLRQIVDFYAQIAVCAETQQQGAIQGG